MSLQILNSIRLAAANTDSDGSGTIVTLYKSPANGCTIEKITIINSQLAAAASSAMVVKVFLSFDAGTTWKFYNEIAIAAVTRTVSAIGAKNIIITGGLMLNNGVLIGVTQTVYAGVQDQQDITIEGENN
jgi:hypothetical protein